MAPILSGSRLPSIRLSAGHLTELLKYHSAVCSHRVERAQVAQDGVLPTWFGRLNDHGVPANAMLFNLVVSIIVVFFGSPFEIYIFSNMGYLLSCSLSLVGYFVLRDLRPQLARPVKMVGALRYVALVCGLFFLVVWAYGGYYASDLLVAADKRWLFFLGIGIVLLYFPLYWYRQTENKQPA